MSSNIWCQVRTKTYIDTDFLTTCVIEDQRKQAWEYYQGIIDQS